MPQRTRKRRRRAPDETRREILDAAFDEFYRNGFQAGSLDAVVARAGVTKGALYHHFPDKSALGYAVLEEVVREPLLAAYLEPLSRSEADPLTALQDVLRRRADDFREIGIAFGCPLNNLTQEMSAVDEGFRERISSTLEAWSAAFADALRMAQESGHVRSEIDVERVAGFVVAAVEGSFGMAKNADSVEVLRSNLEVLADFLETLRPPRRGRRRSKAG